MAGAGAELAADIVATIQIFGRGRNDAGIEN
jgi:hypothetical protein